MGKIPNIHVFVDESGQDDTSPFFVVVAIVNMKDPNDIRRQLTDIEREAKTGKRKWHKLQQKRRTRYLSLALEQRIAAGQVYVGKYQKPIPFFFPLIEVIEKSIKNIAIKHYRATVYVDGIDRKKANELTNALRVRGVSLEMVRSRRDESEPIIRLADMWAGCVRSATLHHANAEVILRRARKEKTLLFLTEK